MTWRAKIASVPMSLAIAVRIDGSAVRSSAGRAGQPLRAGGSEKSATASIASVAEPPLPSASSRPPASKQARSARAAAASSARFVAERLRAQRADLRRLGQHGRAHVREHRVEVVLALAEERIEEARGAGVVHRPGVAAG